MIRKALLVGVVGLSTIISSCGDGMPKDMCDCIGVQVEIMKETADLEFDDPKAKEVEAQYEAEMEACDELSKSYEEKFADMSQEEIEAEQQDILDNCAAYDELQELMDAQMKKFEEQMQDMDMGDMEDMDIDMDELNEEMEQEEMENVE